MNPHLFKVNLLTWIK